MSVAVHNPSTNDMHSIKIAVPKGNYVAKVFNKDKKEFEMAGTSVLCHQDFDSNLTEVESCFAHVKMLSKSREVSLLLLSKIDSNSPKEVTQREIHTGDLI